ncbi:MAG: hypothetical protein WA756_14740, partial [Pseudolabrys sp.]
GNSAQCPPAVESATRTDAGRFVRIKLRELQTLDDAGPFSLVLHALYRALLWRNSRGRPLSAPATFIHPCEPVVAKQSLFYGCLLPSVHRFLHSSFYRSELLAKKCALSYPKVVCVLINVQGIPLTEHLH